MRVAIQGQKGSFHDIASQKIWKDESPELIYCDTFKAVFDAVNSSDAEFGLTAIENSLYGSIHEVYDLLLKYDFWISGETTLPIRQQLIVWEGTELNDIKEVYSHPVAIEQCRYWLANNLPHAELIEEDDTAGAVTLVKEKQLKHAAAIGPELAATNNHMSILARDIEDDSSNFTRFIVISRDKITNNQSRRASISLTAHHKPGALYEALGILFKLGINLTKLESRPIRGERFLYQFIIDFDANLNQLETAVENLTNYGCKVQVMGHYVTHL